MIQNHYKMALSARLFLVSFFAAVVSTSLITARSVERKDDDETDLCIVLNVAPVRITNNTEKENSLVSDGQHSILELAGVDNMQSPVWKTNEQVPLCKSSNGKSRDVYLAEVENSIRRGLNYLAAEVDQAGARDNVMGLRFLKVYDDKHNGHFQKDFPVSNWIDLLVQKEKPEDKVFYEEILKAFQLRAHAKYPDSVLDTLNKNLDDAIVAKIGREEEDVAVFWNGVCQRALVSDCDTDNKCKDFFNQVPSTQYMLTHQALQRIFAESLSQEKCPLMKEVLDENVNQALCSKMYMEAQLISSLKYPESLRDVFAEYIAFCGHMGYNNFFRADWLEEILSQQSKSEYGCFFTSEEFNRKFVLSDSPIVRPQTSAEQKEGLQPTETCRHHLTNVQLMALVAYWDYLQEEC